ncbi:MAG: DUF6880 family protein [Gaiellaceae bacterium]
MGRDMAFCKHWVAAALSWLERHESPLPTLDDARGYLEGLSVASLVDLLIDHAHEDDRLARKLLLQAARPRGNACADIASLRAVIDQAFAYNGFVPYREVWGYVQGIEEVVDILGGLIEEDRAGEVVELAEYALAALECSFEGVDDSDGQLGEVAAQLETLHLDACRRAAPDPRALARRLFAREIDSEWDIFGRAVVRYSDVLGDPGIAEYQALAEEMWTEVPQLRPGDDDHDRYGSRLRITRVMECLAEVSGSLAEQVAVRERDLAIGYRFLQIAELCRAHDDHDAALTWAERGMSAFSERPDPRLRAFIVDEYRRRGRSREALEQSLAAFDERPTLETYREVATDARPLGEWPQRREAALKQLRAPKPPAARPGHHRSPLDRGHSELVRALLWEDDPDAAWSAALNGGCTDSLWLELADRRRPEHPRDTLGVYRDHVERIIGRKDKHAYEEAVRLIDQTIRGLFAETGLATDFPAYVAHVRATHKPKRNLMKLLDRVDTSDAG